MRKHPHVTPDLTCKPLTALAGCAVVFLTTIPAVAAPSLSVRDLKCEHLTNPLGVDVARPQLSWRIESDGQGIMQSAYEIEARDDKGLVWASGRVRSDASVNVSWGGKALRPRQRVEWKVRVWDQSERMAESAPAFFETGIGPRGNWRGSWIGRAERADLGPVVDRRPLRWIWYPEGNPAVAAPAADRRFRKDVHLPSDGKVTRALFAIAADGSADVVINGKSVGRAPGLMKMTVFDVSGIVRPGDNQLELTGHNGGDAAGILGQLRVEGLGAKTVVVSTDRTWQASKDGKEWTEALEAGRVGEGEYWKETRVDRMNLEEMPPGSTLRSTFTVKRPVKRARLYATALGLYEMHLNGARVGDAYLTPGWTNYADRVLYQTYDVTKQIQQGDNAIAALLGGGWFAGEVGLVGRNVYGRNPYLLANLVMELEDGTTQIVVTDETWKLHEGPLIGADLMDGENHDARRETPGFATTGFDDSRWGKVNAIGLQTPPARTLVGDRGPPIRVTETLRPVRITQPKPGIFIADMGQNMTGWTRLSVKGPPGAMVQQRFAEMLNPDGTLYVANLRGAEATDRYTLRGDPKGETFEPRFTFHGFRFVELTGFPGTPTADNIAGRVVHSDIPKTGTFTSSNEMVNQLQRNIDWGQRGNFVSIPTDCPQRDERLGWMGDAQIFVRTATLNRDVAAFFAKWMDDVRDAQSKEGAFPDVAPSPPGMKSGAPAWGDAGVIVPWVLYEQYGDRRFLEDQYQAMTRFVAYVHKGNPDLLWKKRTGNNYGDWLSVDATTDKDLLATAYFAGTTALVARVAGVLGRDADRRRFEALAGKIKQSFQRAFLAADGKLSSDTQTAYVLALRFDLVPADMRSRLAQHLVDDITRRGHRLTTGFLGVGHLLPALTESGHLDVAYRLLESETYPSWGYSIKQGATTIWERWDGWTEKKGFQDPGMNSFNHYSLGSVGEWLYGTVAGVTAAAPGYKRVRIEPRPGGTLNRAAAEITSPYGLIKSAWQKKGNDLSLHIMVPPNTSAEVVVPGKAEAPSGATTLDASGSRFAVGSGTYTFKVALAK
jgi:alpha-L-rhamnosidase